MKIWRVRIACWIPKATKTHSEYVIFIAFPLRQWFQEGASMLRQTYIACLVNCGVITVFYLETQIIICNLLSFS